VGCVSRVLCDLLRRVAEQIAHCDLGRLLDRQPVLHRLLLDLELRGAWARGREGQRARGTGVGTRRNDDGMAKRTGVSQCVTVKGGGAAVSVGALWAA
jgi:hypothetical protein